jgi:hypothetical protein
MTEPNRRAKPEDFEDFFETHRKGALQHGRSISGNENDAADLASFAFYQAFIRWDTFENKGDIYPERVWLDKVMRNQWLAENRRDRRLVEMDRRLQNEDGADAATTYGETLMGDHVGDVAHSVRIYLLTLIAGAFALIRSNPALFGLQEQEIDAFIREFELDDEEITAVDPGVKMAVARVRRVIRRLCLERMSQDETEEEDTPGEGEHRASSASSQTAKFRDALDWNFDVVLETMMEANATEFVAWRRLLVFKAYYSGDGRGVNLTGEETYQICRRYGVAQGSIGGWLQATRPLFCFQFEHDYSELVDRLEASYYQSQIVDMAQRLATFTRREKLMLAGRGYPIPQQRFPTGHKFLPSKFRPRQERGE